MPKYSKLLYLLLIVCFPVCTFAAYDPNHFDPNNAAHWYRKAFALYEEPNNIDLKAFVDGEIESTPELRQYLKRQQTVIDLFSKATQIEYCDWKFDRYKDIWNFGNNNYASDVVDCVLLILANTRHHEQNLSPEKVINTWRQCFNAAQHIYHPNDWDMLLSIAIKSKCYSYIHDYMERNPDMTQNELILLKNLLLDESNGRVISLNELLDDRINFARTALTKHKDQKPKTEPYIEQILALKGQEGWNDFLDKTLSIYEKHINNLRVAVNTPPALRYTAISLADQSATNARDILEKFSSLPENYVPTQKDYDDLMRISGYLFAIRETPTLHVYRWQMYYDTKRNAILTAISLLLEYHNSGNLPEEVSANSPKDAFGNQPFTLIKTGTGFTLKSQSMDIMKDKYPEYEFKLPKE